MYKHAKCSQSLMDDDFFAEHGVGDPPAKKGSTDAAETKRGGGGKMDKMPPDVEERIRALPGNETCADCSNNAPQWASVSYGSLVCLDCSGQHRSLGVHLSFVRSIQMDSWTDKQIEAMERSGGNKSLVDFFKSKGIEQNMQIAKKYNTPQAAYYKERLSRWLDGKTEPPADPGRYDPETGGGDAQGAEPLPGESTEDYNARQARLREQARERMRAKFGAGGMAGMGSEPQPQAGPDLGDAASKAAKKAAETTSAVAGQVGSAVTGGLGYLKSNVIENTDLHDKVRTSTSGAVNTAKGAAAGVATKASGIWGNLKQQVQDGNLTETLKKNATLEEGSSVKKGFSWGMGAATSLWAKASETVGDAISGNQKPCTGDHQLTVDPRGDVKCELCQTMGTRYSCSRGCEYFICPKCFERPPAKANPSKGSNAGADDDGGWGEWEEEDKEPPPEITEDEMARLAKELGMNMGGSEKEPARAAPDVAASPIVAEPKPQPKPKAKPVQDADDFFADFGVG